MSSPTLRGVGVRGLVFIRKMIYFGRDFDLRSEGVIKCPGGCKPFDTVQFG